MTQEQVVQLPGRASQATLIEQTRAVAEVAGAIRVAQECPRSIVRAEALMRQSCSRYALADRAFYSYPRGGNTITGPTIQLARDLARCWGNVQYGIAELSRDDEQHRSEMMAEAWDVETNVRSHTKFLVPHYRRADGKNVPLVDMRDVYENNANQGGRRVREMIFNILPPWYAEEAKALCFKTLENPPGEERSLAARIADELELLDSHGIQRVQVELKLDKPADEWTVHDLARLHVLAESVRRQEVTLAEAFPPRPVTAEEIQAQAAGRAPAPPAAGEPALPEDPRDLGLPPTTHTPDEPPA